MTRWRRGRKGPKFWEGCAIATFSEEFLQELADRSDIVEVVGSYVRLTRRSGANLFGLCPFHNEKTPSFSVLPDKQTYHCFGCGKGGDVIGFIMEIENLSFPDAVAFLARRAGMTLPAGEGAPQDRLRQRLLALNREAARFFYAALSAPGGKPGQAYVLRRQISLPMVKRFGLGFAADDFYLLSNAMREKGFREEELVAAGLANRNKSGRGVHDVFRNRLMFPVIDVRGNVIGFSGRILGEGEPKYLNSRETPVFNKSRNLFGMNLAKKSKNGYILLTEGNIDVVSLHQAGFDSAVASLGTSLTPEQARLISRYSSAVVISYDNDAAGQKASQRAIGILEKLDLEVRVLRMSGAKDPDEFIKANGSEAFRALIEGSENHVAYRLQAAQQRYDLHRDDQRVAWLKEAAGIVAELDSPVERNLYAMRVAETGGVAREAVADEVERMRKRSAYGRQKRERRDAARTLRESVQPKEREIRYENPVSALAEEGVIRLMLLDSSLLDGVPLQPEDFSSPLLGRLFGVLREKAARRETLSLSALHERFSADEIAHIVALQQKPEGMANAARALQDYIRIIRSEQQARREREALSALTRARAAGQTGET